MSVLTHATELLEVLSRSNLLAPKLVLRLRDQIPQEGEPGSDARTFATALVQKGLLTRFQVRRLLGGHTEGYYIDKYRLLDLLGEGGMGKVYLAEQTTMKRAVALKIIELDVDSDDSTLLRFTREAQAVAKLKHPNVTQAYDFDQYRDFRYIAMEFVEGLSLQELVQKVGPIAWAQACDFASQTAVGLENARGLELVHRDIKPGNLMVDRTGNVKILDLGLVSFQSDQNDPLTLQGECPILGTADYVSPEQALDSHHVDTRADIYSLGCVMYFLLTGSPPFAGKSAAQKLLAHQTKTPKSLQAFSPDVPDELAAIVEKMMAKKPADRYQTPGEVHKALKRFAKRVDPPYDASLVQYTRDVVEKLIRHGAEAPASTTRLSAPKEDTSTDYELGDATYSDLDLFEDSDHEETRRVSRSPSSRRLPRDRRIAAPRSERSKRSQPRVRDDRLISAPQDHSPKKRRRRDESLPSVKQSKGKSLGFLVGSVCLLIGLGVAMAAFTFSGGSRTQAREPDNGNQRPQGLVPNVQNDSVWNIGARQQRRMIVQAISQVQPRGKILVRKKAGGWLIDRFLIHGDQLPNQGNFSFTGPAGKVTLVKGSQAPVFRIVNTSGFSMTNVIIDGAGRSGPLIEIEGTAEGLRLENVVLKNFSGDAIRLVGARGTRGRPIQLTNVVFQKGGSQKPGLPIAFRSRKGTDHSRHVRIQGCRLQHNGQAGILVGQPVTDLTVSSTIIAGGPYGIRFASEVLIPAHGKDSPIQDWTLSGWWKAKEVPMIDTASAPSKDPALKWKQAHVDWGTVNLTSHLGKESHVTAWGYHAFQSKKAGPRRLLIGADDEITVWVNGKQVFDHKGHQGHVSREFSCVADFRTGINHVWVKVTNGVQGSAFSIHATDSATPLTVPDWKNVQIEDCAMENVSKGILFSDAPNPGSQITVKGVIFRQTRHYPVLVRLDNRGLAPSTIVATGNQDINPKPERAQHEDTVGFVLVPMR